MKNLLTWQQIIPTILLSLQIYGTIASAAMTIELNPPEPRQGDTVQVLLHDDGHDSSATASDADATTGGATSPMVHFRGKSYKSFPYKPINQDANNANEATNTYRTLLSMPVTLPPGKYTLKSGSAAIPIKVIDAGFGVQVLHLPPSKNNFNGSPGEVQAVDAAKAMVSPHQYWDSSFLRPSKARTSSPFGLRRRVNGVLLPDYFHSGLDFAGAAGSPVQAAQAGRVVIAHMGWKLHGNTIVIDHGQGVLSFYIHLSKILVHEGDMVKAGDRIGAIGSTGRANGPHLHFSVYVNNEASNPSDWFKNVY